MSDQECTKSVCACLFVLFFSACGGSNSTTESGPVVTGESCPALERSSAAIDNEECPDDEPTPPLALTLDVALSGTTTSFDPHVYAVPSGAEVTLISDSGDANLVLYDNVDDLNRNDPYGDNSTRLCLSGFGFKEDHCTATTSDGNMFAVVIPYEQGSYTIEATNNCSVAEINDWVYRNMEDFYIYAEQVPSVDPASYDNPNDLIRDLRLESLDPFSNVQDTQTQTTFFEEGIAFGFGHDWKRDANDNLVITYVYRDSPFGRADIKRGDIALSVGGQAFDENMTNDRYFELVGNFDNRITSTWQFQDRDTGDVRTLTTAMAEYTINSVLYGNVYTHTQSGQKTGYLVFKTFIEPSANELDSVIEYFNNADIDDLIIDLRYNGGGRSYIGRRFASQIVGASQAENIHSRFSHNSKYRKFDYEESFFEVLPELGLSRLAVITTGRSASASERLINSLRPYMEVTTIGETTRGKVFRSAGRKFCGKTLNAMQAQGVNASYTSVAGGIPANCYAEDDLSRDFGLQTNDELEGMLGSALSYLHNGTCATAPLAKSAPSGMVPQVHESRFDFVDD